MMKWRSWIWQAIGLAAILLFGGGSAAAQTNVTAFVDVNVLLMDVGRIAPGQTVLVRQGRIAAIGPTLAIDVPAGAAIIEGRGRYLIPGLVDSHVHLPGTTFFPARADFGDAPLYLAYGVTTVVNMGGTPEVLDWRRQVEAGTILGPTIYTAGRFVNEPLVNDPDAVRREVQTQARAGYDLVKFREVMDPSGRFQTTTRGLDRASYHALNVAARSAGMPIIGHAPVNLGLEALLEEQQSLAHIGALSNLHFLPLAANRNILVATGVALSVLLALVFGWAGAAIFQPRPPADPRLQARRWIKGMTSAVLTVGLVALAGTALVLPGGPLFASRALRILISGAAAISVVGAVSLCALAVQLWRNAQAPRMRLSAGAAALAASGLAIVLVGFWAPVAWRSDAANITKLAERLAASDIVVVTTLVNYEFLAERERAALIDDSAMGYLPEPVRSRWRSFPREGRPLYHYHDFTRAVARELHRAGVPLLAGTDALGFPLIVPGASLHRELKILVDSGLSPLEALRTATTNPATFLGAQKDFGEIAVGRRADLLLVSHDPLQDLSSLRRPDGVMARGRWVSREDLDRALERLAE